MARGIQQIEDTLAMLELHHRGGHGNPALLFHLHPVRRGVTCGFATLDGTRQLDGATEQQQFFSQRGFAGIRVGDDGESSSPLEFRR